MTCPFNNKEIVGNINPKLSEFYADCHTSPSVTETKTKMYYNNFTVTFYQMGGRLSMYTNETSLN